jgi:outer membrane murein-binding lipoprotein Lpp
MFEMLGMLAAAIISGIVAGVVAAGKAVSACMSNYQQEIKHLTDAVEHLKKEKVEKLEITVTKHVENDQTQRVITSMEHVSGNLKSLDCKIERLSKDISEQNAMIREDRSEIKAAKEYIHNLDESFQNHKNIHHRNN